MNHWVGEVTKCWEKTNWICFVVCWPVGCEGNGFQVLASSTSFLRLEPVKNMSLTILSARAGRWLPREIHGTTIGSCWSRKPSLSARSISSSV